MDNVYAILVLVGIVAFALVLGKVKRATNRAINQKLFYRTEHQEGQRLTAGLTISTSASIPNIMTQLQTHVVTSDAPLGFGAVIYETSRESDRVSYALGNKLQPVSFRVVVALSEEAGATEGVFAVLNWTEINGMIAGQDQLRELRRQIKTAFKAADPNVQFFEGLPEASSQSIKSNQTSELKGPVTESEDIDYFDELGESAAGSEI